MREIIEANRRSIALQALSRDASREANGALLQSILRVFGHHLSQVELSGMIDWLRERGLVTVREIGGGVSVIRLTQAGLDCAEGRSRVTGVDLPPI